MELITKAEIHDKLQDICEHINELIYYNSQKKECILLAEQFRDYIDKNNLYVDIDSLADDINNNYEKVIEEISELVNDLINDLNECLESDSITRVRNDRIDFILERIEEVLEILQKYDYDTCDIVSDEDIKEIQQLINESLSYDKLKKKR